MGLDEIHAKSLPEDKLNRAEKELPLIASKRKVAYVGDGINDAPILARVDIVILNDTSSKIVVVIDIVQKTLQIVK